MRSIRAVVAAGALAMAACSSDVVGPPPALKQGSGTFAVSQDGTPPLTSNAIKYRDNGAKPGTGKSGSAVVMARALLGSDGNTVVEASTGELDGAAFPGVIAKVQMKTGTEVSNYNDLAAGGYWSTTVASLPYRGTVQLQANVRDSDPERTDVVTVMTSVVKRPDLAARNLSVPTRVFPNTLVNVSALIEELNGDVGARANCVLRVNGMVVDDAAGIWVDAGDAVACAFQTSFAATGSHQVSVSAEGVVPGDWDSANNSVSGSVDVIAPEIRMNWQLIFQARDETYDYGYTYGSDQEAQAGTIRERSFGVYSTSPELAPAHGPVSFQATVTTDGAQVGTVSANGIWNANAWRHSGFDCWYATASSASFQLCRYPQYGMTVLEAVQNSARYVYHGWHTWYGYVYTFSGDITQGLGGYPIPADWFFFGVDVRATDAVGTVWRADASVLAGPYQDPYTWSACDHFLNADECHGGGTVRTWFGFNIGN